MPTLHVGDALLVAEVFDELLELDVLLDVVDEVFVDEAVLEEGIH